MKPDGGKEKLRSFTYDILSGLSYLHRNRVVHMDMKPANLMVMPVRDESEYPLVKISDFGLSRLVDADGFVDIEKRCGTDKFIAPEVKDGARISCAVDMWSFGMILHLLAVGFLPYALKWAPGEPLKFIPRHWRKYESSGLTNLIELCLQVDPVRRVRAEDALMHEWFSCDVGKI
jgi:serine/threonine protein kinase